MSKTQSQQKDSLLRVLAIAGLVGIIVLIAWVSVQIVKVAPSAFSSLASLVEGINQYEDTDELTEVPLSPQANSDEFGIGERVALTIGDPEAIGTYTFSYNCEADVTLIAHNSDGGRQLTCGTVYNLTSNELELELLSAQPGTTTVAYEVGFLRPTDEAPYRTGSGTLFAIVVDEETESEPEGEVAGESTSDEESAEEPDTPVVVTQPEPTIEYVYEIPTSNPNGTVDLAARYIGVGDESGLTGTLDQNSTGVFFFEVKNIGSKTSDDWRFSVELPDGEQYNSDRQAPLKPNERATLALTVTTDNDSSHTFRVEVETDEDRNEANNDFSERVNLR